MKPSQNTTAAPAGAGRLRAYLIFAALLIAAWVLWSGMLTCTPPVSPGWAGPWKCAVVAGPVMLP